VAAKTDLHEHLAGQLVEGERVLVTTTVQVKGGQKRALAQTAIVSTAATLAITAATGGTMGLLVAAVPPAAWFVGTTERVMLIERTNLGKSLGATLFVAPRSALSATLKSGLLTEVTITDRSDGQSLLRLNVGVKRGLAKQIVAAVQGGTL
jgi:hypothetical protein